MLSALTGRQQTTKRSCSRHEGPSSPASLDDGSCKDKAGWGWRWCLGQEDIILGPEEDLRNMLPQRICLSSVSWRCRNSDITLHVCNQSKQGARALRYPGLHLSVPLSGSSVYLKVQSLCELQQFLHLSEPICKTKDISLSPLPSPALSLSPPLILAFTLFFWTSARFKWCNLWHNLATERQQHMKRPFLDIWCVLNPSAISTCIYQPPGLRH